MVQGPLDWVQTNGGVQLIPEWGLRARDSLPHRGRHEVCDLHPWIIGRNVWAEDSMIQLPFFPHLFSPKQAWSTVHM